MSDVDGTALVKGLFSMIPYTAGPKDTRPVLQGVTMYMGEKAAAAAADGFRMVYAPLPISFGTGGTLIFPLYTLRVLNYLWDKTPVVVQLKPGLIETLFSKKMLTLAVGTSGTETCKWAGFKFGTIKVISNLIEGNPPDHKSLIPKPDNTIRVLATELNRAVIRTKDVALAASGIVRSKWSKVEGAPDFGDQLDVYATAIEIGEVSAEIKVSAPDGPGHVAINYKSLTEYLKGKDGVVKMGISSKGSGPILFEYPNTPLTLVMPMMVQW